MLGSVMVEPMPMPELLEKFGFTFKNGSVHTKRTMMLNELVMVLEELPLGAGLEEYGKAIIEENCTHKPSTTTRKFTASYLKDLYALDHQLLLFRALRKFWGENNGLLAFLVAHARDSILRKLTPYILAVPIGTKPSKPQLLDKIEQAYPNRFSEVMKSSLSRNILSTWTQSGHLEGSKNKVRVTPSLTPEVVTMALLMDYVNGHRGELIFQGPYTNLLNSSPSRVMELAESASRKGLMVFKKIGSVVEVQFPELLSSEERDWLRE